jgi:transposase
MRPLSDDLRQRILDAVDNHEGSQRELAERFAVNPSTITRLLQLRRQTGSAAPRPHGGGKPPTLDPDALERLRQLVREDSDATLEQYRQRLGIQGSIMIIWRGLKRLGITRKKKSLHAAERDRPEVQNQRRAFRRNVQPIEPKRLVFVDEAGVTTAMTPAYGRAPRGERVESSAPASWQSVTVVAAMGLDGVRAPMAYPGGTGAATFEAYVEQILVPELRPGDVVVFDNLAAHRGPAVAEAIEGAGACVLRLPPYSPDFTPIEQLFSKLKERLRRLGTRTKDRLYQAIREALNHVTPQDILGWFQHAGLRATHV